MTEQQAQPGQQADLEASVSAEEEEAASTIVRALLAESSNPGLSITRAWLDDMPLMAIGLIREKDDQEVVIPLVLALTEGLTERLRFEGTAQEVQGDPDD